MPLFRSRSQFRVPSVKFGPMFIFVLAFLVIGGLVVLAVIEPRPPLRQFEVTIPNERFAR